MNTLLLHLKERSYPIHTGRDILSRLADFLKAKNVPPSRVLVVSQKQVAIYYAQQVMDGLNQEGHQASLFLTPNAKSSEAAKSQRVAGQLISKIAACDGKNQPLLLVALGGGVIGDLTGFVASVYRRGIPYVQIPTTLTAQVDSAIGGKTGVDLPAGKNLLGSIYQPVLVLSDSAVLSSLPERHWSDGFSEVIKYGIIEDATLFSWLEEKGMEGIRSRADLLEKVIVRCAKIKSRVVEQDEWDKKGIRLVLNFGHTVGHALEAASRFSRQYTHGEAVAIGMLIACDIAEKLGILEDRKLTNRLEKTLLKFNLPVFYKGLKSHAILQAIGYDKKSERGVNRFILPIRVARTTIVRDVPVAAILEALERRKG